MFDHLRQFWWHPPNRPVAFAFFAMSLLFGSWIARLPEIQQKLALSDGQLGGCLLAVSLGALITTALSNYLFQGLRGGRATYLSIIGLALFVPCVAVAPAVPSLIAAFVGVGFFNCLLDIAMNNCASAIEQRDGVRILSTCHGIFSLGGMIGAALSGALSSWGVHFAPHLTAIALPILVFNFYLRRDLEALPSLAHAATNWHWPPPALWSLVIIGFCIMLGEGAVADWSAIYLKNHLGTDAFVAGLGFAGFSLTMTIGRLSGDRWRERLHNRQIIWGGSLLGALGLFLVALSAQAIPVVIGFGLVGLGFSCVVPLLFSQAGRLPGIDPGQGIAAVTGSGILGFLCGPPLMGLVAEGFGLAVSFGLVALLAALAFALSYHQFVD
ncbi:MAG: MFS transporter [Bacteroidota bacterium]